jgi:hypothetical protein
MKTRMQVGRSRKLKKVSVGKTNTMMGKGPMNLGTSLRGPLIRRFLVETKTLSLS